MAFCHTLSDEVRRVCHFCSIDATTRLEQSAGVLTLVSLLELEVALAKIKPDESS